MNPAIQLKSLKKLSVLFLLYCLSIEISNAQNDEISEPNEYNNNSYLTLNLLSSASPTAPRWRVGYIKNINERLKIGIDAGYGNHNIIYYDLGDNYELWEIRLELYYFLKNKRKTKKYLSAEIFYINHTDIFTDGHYFSEDGQSISYDEANYQRQKYGLNFKYGFLFHSKKRIGFNLYTGLGLRIRNNTFSNITNPEIVDLGLEGGDMFGFDNYKNIEGTEIAPNFVLGFKIYYRLNN